MTKDKSPNMKVNIAGIEMSNPLMVASGTFGFGEEFTRVEGFHNEDIGAIVLKATTLEPRIGNPPPRIVETAGGAGILNSIGLQNPGVDRVIKELLPRLERYDTKFIANVAGSTIEEYCEVAKRFDGAPIISGIELNISCPNVEKGGAAFGADPEVTSEVVSKARQVTKLPLIVKLSPNVTDIGVIARAAVDAGADALSLINTLQAMAIDTKSKKAILGHNFGGLSGPAVKPVAVRKVFDVYKALDSASRRVPIIGMGGICNADDAMEFILAGASAVAAGTALFRDSTICKNIVADLEKLVTELGETDINDLVGTVALNK